MERATGAAATTTRGLLWQGFGYLGGMTAYAVHLMGGVALVPLSCEIGTTLPLSALNWAVIAVCALATVVSWKIFTAAKAEVARTGATSARRSRFLGFSGTLMNVLAIVIVLFVEAHVLVLDPCFPR
jgi:hypothetical protein